MHLEHNKVVKTVNNCGLCCNEQL